jgi:hypothetical protein
MKREVMREAGTEAGAKDGRRSAAETQGRKILRRKGMMRATQQQKQGRRIF